MGGYGLSESILQNSFTKFGELSLFVYIKSADCNTIQKQLYSAFTH